MIDTVLKELVTQENLAIFFLAVGNIVQWRRGKELENLYVELVKKNTVIIERLTQRIEDIKK